MNQSVFHKTTDWTCPNEGDTECHQYPNLLQQLADAQATIPDELQVPDNVAAGVGKILYERDAAFTRLAETLEQLAAATEREGRLRAALREIAESNGYNLADRARAALATQAQETEGET